MNEVVASTRRGLFRLGAGAAVAAAAASTVDAQKEFDYGGWFEDVPNFERTVDRTGEDEVTVTVCAGGDLAFDPPAVHVDSGTTVVFAWDQGFHNVAEKESGERYASETADEPGTTYAVTFESDGVSTYAREPHRARGMKGAVAVGSGEGTLEVSESEMQVGGEGGEGSDGSDGGGESEGVGVDTNTLALYRVAAVITFLSPLGFFHVDDPLRRQQDAPAVAAPCGRAESCDREPSVGKREPPSNEKRVESCRCGYVEVLAPTRVLMSVPPKVSCWLPSRSPSVSSPGTSGVTTVASAAPKP